MSIYEDPECMLLGSKEIDGKTVESPNSPKEIFEESQRNVVSEEEIIVSSCS